MAVKYAINFQLICSNPNVLDTVVTKYQNAQGGAITTLYKDASRRIDTEIHPTAEILSGQLFFVTELDRNTLKTQVDPVNLLGFCEAGSYIKVFDSTHFKDGNQINAEGRCVATQEWSV